MIKKTDNLKPYHLLLFTLLCSPLSTYAQDIAMCSTTVSDPDGDGWGWENNASCLVAAVNSNTDDQNCIDTDGDGWGWNGVESCRVAQAPVSNTVEANNCVDTDGDGWGWNGVASCRVTEVNTSINTTMGSAECVDPDDDGWGWNGIASCRVTTDNTKPIPTSTPVASEETLGAPYRNSYSTITNVSWFSAEPSFTTTQEDIDAATNGWIFREPGAPLGYLQGLYSRVVLCDNGATTVEDPSNPGMLFDVAKGQTCAQSSNLSIPAPEPVEFSDIGIEVLYENGHQWSCFEETRPSMITDFEASGTNGSINFDLLSSPVITIGNVSSTLTAPSIRRGRFDSQEFRSRLTFGTNVSYQDNTLTLYFSGLRRMICDRTIEKNYPFTLHGQEKAVQYAAMWNDFIGARRPQSVISSAGMPDSQLPRVRGEQLAGLTLECDGLYGEFLGALSVSAFSASNTYRVGALGNNEFLFDLLNSDVVETPYTESTSGEFENANSFLRRAYYQYSEDLYLGYILYTGPVGSSSGSRITITACEVTATQ